MSSLIEAARDVYLYGLPLVIGELTHRGTTDKGLYHFREFPTIKDPKLGMPNSDTLYTLGFMQLANTPYLLHIPEIRDRYFLFPILDAYNNVRFSLGTRTNTWGDFILLYGDSPVPEGYENYQVLRSKDSFNGALMRIETRGKEDYEFVHKLQDSVSLTPLYPERVEPVLPDSGKEPNVEALGLSVEEFYTLFANLSEKNPIKKQDIADKFSLFGYERSTGNFQYGALSEEQRDALEKGKEAALITLQGTDSGSMRFTFVNGWVTTVGGLGCYDDDDITGAKVAVGGWGTNLVADSIYATAKLDSQNQPLLSSKSYKIHFEADGYPHAGAFWSLAIYGMPSGLVSSHESGRFSYNNSDIENGVIEKNEDGSLDIIVSKEEPQEPRERKNWIPAVFKDEQMCLTLRIYMPDQYTLDGKWNPPVITAI